jgi:hypothetical protein
LISEKGGREVEGRIYQCSLGTAMMGAFNVMLLVSLFSNSASNSNSTSLEVGLVTPPRTKARRTKMENFNSGHILFN